MLEIVFVVATTVPGTVGPSVHRNSSRYFGTLRRVGGLRTAVCPSSHDYLVDALSCTHAVSVVGRPLVLDIVIILL